MNKKNIKNALSKPNYFLTPIKNSTDVITKNLNQVASTLIYITSRTNPTNIELNLFTETTEMELIFHR